MNEQDQVAIVRFWLTFLGFCMTLALIAGLVLSSGCDYINPKPVPYTPPAPTPKPEPKPEPQPEPVMEKTHGITVITQEGCSPCERLKQAFEEGSLADLIADSGPCTFKTIDLREARRHRDYRSVRSTPTLFLSDIKGRIVLKHVGFNGDDEALADKLTDAIAADVKGQAAP